MNRWIPGVVLAVAVSGCQCGGVSVDEQPAKMAQTVCGKIYACCAQNEVANNQLYGPDQQTCETRLAAQLDQRTAIQSGEQAGRLAYHGDRLAECLSQYTALTCEQLKSNATTVTPACDAYLEPKVAVGGACGIDGECVGGSCEGASGSADGVCLALLAEGAGCNDGGTCGDGLYCAGSCARQKADGTACNANFECATGGCNGRDADAGTPGTCGLKGGAGTTCYATEGCSAAPGFTLLALLVLAGLLLRRR